MVVPRWVVAAWLLAPLMAGCLGGDANAPDDLPQGAAGATDTAGDANGTLNASFPILFPAVDPWVAGETERVLFEGTVQSGTATCVVPYALAPGTIVPEGTARLRFWVDVSGALKAGSYHADAYTYANRYLSMPDTTEPVHEWTVDLEPRDWEPASHTETGYGLSYECIHTPDPSFFNGPLLVKLTAERLPDWTPLPVPDVWAMPATHRSPQTDVLTLLEHNTTFTCQPTPAGGGCDAFPALDDRVPLGATKLILAVAWTPVTGCPAGHTCNLRSPMNSGGRSTTMGLLADLDHGPTHSIMVYDVPEMAAEDSHYANGSSTTFGPWIDQCTPAETYPSCGTVAVAAPLSTEARFLVEAWRGDVDFAAVRARLGVA